MGRNINPEELSKLLTTAAGNIGGSLEKAIKLCCTKIQSDIQESMSNTQLDVSKSYYTNNKTKAHHPSMPGNPPAPDTGNLRQSIRYEVHGEGKEVYGLVGSTQKDPPYGAYLEYGTSKVEPRPWLRPAMRENEGFVRNALAKAVREGLEK